MLDFSAVARGEQSLADLGRDLTLNDLRILTDDMIDTLLEIVADATDADVTFQPDDPAANDPGAPEDERNMGWTLAHVLVHTTAGSEESAAVASTLARGVLFEGRSRYETPWQEVRTLEQLHARLAESLRMRQSFLNTWPDEPNLELIVTPVPHFGPLNATARYLLGLLHEYSHLDQLREIMRQAKAARGA
jgi:hypothetical protein